MQILIDIDILYLGIILHEGMRWLHHIQSICNKANKSLNFLRRNLSKCSINVKENAYLTIVRPLLEYAACVWDPYQEYLIYDLEKIQRREQLDGFFLITTIIAV